LRRRAVSRLALVLCAAVLAVAVAGCKNSLQILPDNGDEGWFAKPVDIFHKPDWAVATSGDQSAPLTPSKPVAPDELVGADGRCTTPAAPRPAAAAAAAPAPPPDRPVGSLAGDLARAPMPAAAPAFANQGPGAPSVLGGVALGMSECEVVRRAGPPGNVNIGVGDRGSRKVVLTYLSGPWPGIYTFDSGRLKVVDRAPEQPAPVQESPKTKKAKKKPAKPKTATREIERFYVR
jgi:hypothetical protein